MSSGVIDLPAPGGPQDSEAELDGTITNNTKGIREIRDIRFWFEDGNGNKLKDGNGGCPIASLRTKAGSGTPANAATLVSHADGISTFNLADPVGRGSFVSYDAQVDYFNEDANFKIKMAFSQKTVAGKHFDTVGMAELTEGDSINLSAAVPTTRTGVVVTVRNVSGTQSMIGASITLVSNQSTLEFLSAMVLDKDDEPVEGAQLSISDDGKTATVTGVSVINPNLINVWLDLNDPYTAATVFQVSGSFN